MPRNPNAACSTCGKPVHRSHSSRSEITCHECRRKNPASKYRPAFCEQCGNEFQSRRSGQSPTGWTRYCSRTCYTATRFITPGVRKQHTWASMSEEARARKRHRARQRHRAHQLTYDGVSDEQILQRDNWRCRMDACLYRSRRINPEYRYPDQRSASIDHILPLSLGGDDTEYNKRAAHLGCNMARGQGKPGEQLPMAFGLDPDLVLEPKPLKKAASCGTCGELIQGERCTLHMPVRWCKLCDQLIPHARSNSNRCRACRAVLAVSRAEQRKAREARPSTCKVKDCDRRVFAILLCAPHFHRLNRHGDLFEDIPVASNRLGRIEVSRMIQERLTGRAVA